MADIVKTIEIDAALSPDYAPAFKAAADQANALGAEIKALSRREDDLRRLQALGAAKSAAAISGDAKAAASAAKAYDAFARRIGAASMSSDDLVRELGDASKRLVRLRADKAALDASAELGKTAAEMKRLQAVYDKFGGESVKRQLDAVTNRFKALGGTIKAEPVGRLATMKAGISSMAKEAALSVPGVGTLGRIVGETIPAGALVAAGAIIGFGAALYGVKSKIDEFVDSAVKMGDEIAKDSKALGVSTDFYQSMSYAMQRGGASAQGFTNGLKSLDTQIQAALDGNAQAIKSFKAFGVSVADLRNKNTEEVFLQLAEGAKTFENTADLARSASKLLGGEGYRLAAAMAVGSEELQSLREEARKSGNVFNNEFLTTAENTADAMLNADMRIAGMKNQLGAAVVPSKLARIEAFNRIIDENRELIDLGISALAGFARVINWAVIGTVTGVTQTLRGFREAWQGLKSAVSSAQDNFAAACLAISSAWTEYAEPMIERVKGFFDYVKEAPGYALDSAVYAVRTGFNELLATLNDYAKKMADIPLIGGLLSGDGPLFDVGDLVAPKSLEERVKTARGASAGPVTIYNSIDARGAAPGAAQDVRRAMASVGDALANLFSNDSRLTYAKGGVQ